MKPHRRLNQCRHHHITSCTIFGIRKKWFSFNIFVGNKSSGRHEIIKREAFLPSSDYRYNNDEKGTDPHICLPIIWFFTKEIKPREQCIVIFSCVQAALQMVFSVCLSVCLSHLFDYVPIIVSSLNFHCFSRSSVKFQGHTALKIVEFDLDWAFPDCNSSLNSPMATKWCTKFEVA